MRTFSVSSLFKMLTKNTERVFCLFGGGSRNAQVLVRVKFSFWVIALTVCTV